VGGAQPVVFGVSLPRRLLVAFRLEGERYEFNFSKFWTGSKQRFDCPVSGEKVEWNIEAWTRRAKVGDYDGELGGCEYGEYDR